MKKKSKFGFNTGNRVSSVNSGHGRIDKDQCTVIKTFRHKYVQPQNAMELNTRILKTTDSLVQDGVIDGAIDYVYPQRRWISRETVMYSLNKRKRWLLRQRILDAIEGVRDSKETEEMPSGDGPQVSQNPSSRISLLERAVKCSRGYMYHVKRKNDSISYSTSIAGQSEVVPRKSHSSETDLKIRALKKPHIDQKEVARKKRRKKGHNQHFRDLQRDERLPWAAPQADPNTPEIPEIHYEVCGPQHTPYKSYPSYSDLRGLKSKKKTKHARNKLRHHEELTAKDLMELTEACRDSDVDAGGELFEQGMQNELETEAEGYFCKACVDVPLLCFPKVLRQHQRKAKIQRSTTVPSFRLNETSCNPVKNYGKKAVVYELYVGDSLKEESLCVTPDVSYLNTEISNETSPLAVCTKVNSNSVFQKSLESWLGDAYLEGCSCPRRFSVNMPQYILDMFPGYLRTTREDHLLLVCTVYDENNNETSAECKIESAESSCDINMEIHGRCWDIELSDIHSHLLNCATDASSSVNFASLVHNLASFLHGKLADNIVTKEESTLTSPTESGKFKYRYFGELNTWEMQYYTPSEACDIVKELPLFIHQRKFKRLDSHSIVRHITSADFASDVLCDICLSAVPVYSNTKTYATALSSCKHWFCDICWKEHLTEKIRTGSVSLECPSYDCNKVVDLVTLLSLVGHNYYKKHWNHLQHTKLDQRPDWQWCPRTSCDRVVHGSFKTPNGATSRACVQCACLHTWCFDCQKEPHWPVSCEISEKYIKLVKQLQEDQSTIFFVDVKKCPLCKYPIDKNGGCQHMYCRCGHSFCWECLAPWSDHGPYLTCPTGRTGLITLELENTSKMRVKEEYLAKAAEYRKKKNQLSHCKSKVKGRLVHVMMRISRKESRRKRPKLFIQQPQSLNNLDFFLGKASFLYEMYHLLEFTCAWVSQSTNKSLHTLLKRVDLLCIFTQKFSNSLFVEKTLSIEEWMLSLNKGEETLRSLSIPVSRNILRSDD